jgi:hypothetical protein
MDTVVWRCTTNGYCSWKMHNKWTRPGNSSTAIWSSSDGKVMEHWGRWLLNLKIFTLPICCCSSYKDLKLLWRKTTNQCVCVCGHDSSWHYGSALARERGTAVAEWLRYCATNQKVAGSIPDGVMEFFIYINPSDRTMALGSTQPLTEMSTGSISWG